jgi:transposase
MVRGNEIPNEKRAQIQILYDQNMSQRKIAAILKVSQSAVSRAIARMKQLGTTKSRKRTGRPRRTSASTDRMIRRSAVAHPTWSSSHIRAAVRSPVITGTPVRPPVSTRTVRRRLLVDFKLPSRRPAKKAKLSKKNIKDRLAFCTKYKNWTKADWMKVMFSDESTFTQFYSACRYVRRPANQRYNMRYVVPTVKQAPTTMVWGSFCGSGRGGIWFMPKNTTINGQVYLSILQDKLETHMGILNCTTFQHDGAPCHRAATVTRWINGQGINILGPWPGSSPDLNPIENLWMYMKRKVAEEHPTSEVSLVEAIKRVWVNHISPAYCETLVNSMPGRLKAVLANKGQYSKY